MSTPADRARQAPAGNAPVDSSLVGKVVTITGASGGIGRVLARRFAQCGARVALVARRADELAITAQAIIDDGGAASVHAADIRDETQCVQVVTDIHRRWGALDVLVNNAAVPGIDEQVSEATSANWHNVVATNLLAPMILSREALTQAMIPARSGNIQFVSSAAARHIQPRKAHYAAAKLGLSALAQTLATEVGEFGIRVNTLVLGSVAGALFDSYVARRSAEDGVDAGALRQHLTTMNGLRRLVEPEEVAEVSIWLASAAASAITGQDIAVTGG
ncbi:SDR family oxidoreductase [Mycobacterium sp. UM_Kg1]|uniref:SDR family NAD(P)-dependent oxidoreductase n=1 Tax=Mycobacterium sp. UM_Kg1 TaxID=1545691 RepID=UPI0009E3B12B|nr:SDR family oxidoreductase [Mycobacterium sp. UM_Kg1]